jgi:hypothetical protein
MTFQMMNSNDLGVIAKKLEGLSKSFSAGFPGMQNAGRTQTSAISVDNLESTMRSITLEEQDFLLLKDIQQMPAKQTVYQYVVKTAVRSGVDLWGIENYLPQEDHAKYMRVAEILKIQGIRKTITHMAQLVNEQGGYMVDLEAENDQNAALAMSESLERSLYAGGDYYMDAFGAIDATIAANPNGPIRQIRGIQAQVREGNRSARGIIGDFIGFGNNQATLFDAKGGVLTRELVDKVCVAIRNNRGKAEEAHCTTNQLQAFRTTFFPFERGDMSQWYQIKGAGVDIEPKEGFPLMTVTGNVQFVPSVFKFNRMFPEAVVGSVGSAPSTPVLTAVPAQSAGTTTYKAGDVVKYVVQAVNIHGMSGASAEKSVTIAADGNKVTLSIDAQAGVEEFWVFRTEANGASGSEAFIGRVIADRSGSATSFCDAQAMLPGLDNVIFMPKKANRGKLAVLGSLLSKMKLGRLGLSEETLYVSYLAHILEYPRMYGVVGNVYQELNL